MVKIQLNIIRGNFNTHYQEITKLMMGYVASLNDIEYLSENEKMSIGEMNAKLQNKTLIFCLKRAAKKNKK